MLVGQDGRKLEGTRVWRSGVGRKDESKSRVENGQVGM